MPGKCGITTNLNSQENLSDNMVVNILLSGHQKLKG